MTYALRKRILVTGGASFLGSHLCEHLLADGHDVLCADNWTRAGCGRGRGWEPRYSSFAAIIESAWRWHRKDVVIRR